ncbi:hypothetical protein HMPREF9583_01568 [Cutibacterium acnes HL038PA1]|nr:hypothetical protein HMPREF9583_01568 [Cutibacterium acnes HL038PA1]
MDSASSSSASRRCSSADKGISNSYLTCRGVRWNGLRRTPLSLLPQFSLRASTRSLVMPYFEA